MFSALRYVHKSKLQQFSFDITAIAFALRCGYLFDAFGLRRHQTELQDFLAEVLTKLRDMLPVFESVTLLYDPASDQIFFVSVPRLRTYYELDSRRLSDQFLAWVSFIEVRGTMAKICPPPVGLPTVFDAVAIRIDVQKTTPVMISLPDDDGRSMGDMVAFAACIIEFPVAYVPIPDGPEGGAFLAREPLDVYDCVLVPHTAQEQAHSEAQSLIKFSCPQAIGLKVPELSPKSLIERLTTRFAERVGSTTSRAFVVCHSVQTLDRVAM
ncbi:hypothetical protein OH76DRAFT_1411093 [Lentinus brumalis]|uniref:Uncharacterized protein n=1 Tax=Lentinus brumalis TaxID=2498619 RepID=A0A371CQE4_9APHY|nr:hypothetical protein OH76DRAFT_1411093 [Polyporus brumalis]